MPQLVDNLTRRRAALSRRAGHERMAASPRREIRELPRKRRRAGGNRCGFCSRIVDGRHDGEDVDRHIDLAGDGRHVRGLQSARVVPTVCKNDNGAPPAFAFPGTPGGLRDRIVERRCPEGHDGGHGVRQCFETRRKRLDFLEARIERENRRFIAGLEPAQKMFGGLPRVRQMVFHTAADIEQQRDADARGLAMEIGDRSWPARFQNLEIARREIADEPSFVIPHDGCDAYDVHTRSEGRDRRLLAQQSVCQSKGKSRRQTSSPNSRPGHGLT
jgi:hypothetical protein